MEWWQAAPAIAVAAGLLILPGLVFGIAAGARGILLWGSAGPVSVSLIALTAIASGHISVAFTVTVVVVVTAVSALLVLLARILIKMSFGSSPPEPPTRLNWASGIKILTALSGSALLLFRLARIFGHPDNISQTLDNIFHLNLVRFILDTGNGSSLTAGQLTDLTADSAPYPAAWHDIVALTAALADTTVPVAVNAVSLVIGGFIWLPCVILLGVSVCGDRLPVWVAAALIACGFPSFPYLMLEFGVLYANYLSLALLPAMLALCAVGAGKGPGHFPRGSAWILFAAALPGLGLSHPSSILALIALTLPIFFSTLMDGIRSALQMRTLLSRAFLLRILGATGYLALVAYVWTTLRPALSASGWEPYMRLAQAMGEGLLNAPLGRTIPVTIVVLTFLGIGKVLRDRRDAWLLGVFGISVGLYTVAAGMPWSDFRSFVVGNWYNDSFRLAAVLPIGALGLTVMGGVSVLELAVPRSRKRDRSLWAVSDGFLPATAGSRVTSATPAASAVEGEPKVTGAGGVTARAAGGLLLLSLLVWANMPAEAEAVARAARNYEISPTAKLLSVDERKLLERIDTLVPADSAVIGSPWTGAALVYALSNRQAIPPHVFWTTDPQTTVLLDQWDEAVPGGEICDAVMALDAYYALDFGSLGVHGEAPPPTGLDNLVASGSVELVEEVGEARLYKVTACGPEPEPATAP